MPDKAPPKKPKNFTKMLDMLDSKAAVNTLSPKTYVDLVGSFARKAYENGELEVDEYLRIVKPLFGETGEMVTEKIENYRTNMLDGGDTKYNAMVTAKYIELGGKEGTGMDIDKFAEEYFKKFADGGRAQFGVGPLGPDTRFNKRVKELMDDGYEFGEAVKEAMKETRENNFSGSGDYAKKYLKYKDKPTQDKFNKIVNDLRIDMSLESAISEGLRQIKENE